MRRRDLLALLAAAAAARPFGACAQERQTPVVGILAPGSPERLAPLFASFHKAMAEAGFVEGYTLKVEYRFAGSDPDRFPALAADLVSRRVDAIWTGPDLGALAARKATAAIPIVFSYVPQDPVELGLVESVNRPGGNITGIGTFAGRTILEKRLQMLHEMVPAAARIGFLAVSDAEVGELAAAAKTLGVEVMPLKASEPEDIEPALAAGKQTGIGAVLVQAHAFFYAEQKRLVELLARYALPASRVADFAAMGGLMSYGPDQEDVAYRAGTYVARILKGARPADLPVIQPTKFKLVINLKTAKALGLTVPLSLLAAADEVIE
jgi:putative tryptophan/tyrosine transport system substrate-binding protein